MRSTYTRPDWQRFADLRRYIAKHDHPVVLLEGTRQLPAETRPQLVALGRRLARAFPQATFRTGNAVGTDTAFAEGVAAVDAARLQFVLPNDRLGRARIPLQSYAVSLEQLNPATEALVAEATVEATPNVGRTVRYYLATKSRNRPAMQATYLLRDTVKVLGASERGLRAATVGLFYVNEADPLGGGTGHTIRVCLAHNVPVLTQSHWQRWQS